MITLDFETKSRVDLKKCGMWRYAEDISTDVHCLCFAVSDGPVQIWKPGQPFPKDLRYYLDYGMVFEAHNAFFEKAIWRNVMVRKYGWPDIPDSQWSCSAAKAAAHALPRSLDQVGQALNLPVQKDRDGYKVMMKLCKPAKDGDFKAAPEDLAALYKYCRQDVEAERVLSKRLRDLSAKEQEIWRLDQRMNERGVMVDRDAVEAALILLDEFTRRLKKEAQIVAKGEVDPAKREKMLFWLDMQGVDLDGYTKNDVSGALAGDLPGHVRRLLEIRQQLGKTSTSKYEAFLRARCSDGRIRDLLMYHGAGTGRWTGKLVQLQNLPRGNVKDIETCIWTMKQRNPELFEFLYGPDVLGAISSCIRGMLIASPGKVLYVADYAAIEARVLFWVAGEKRGLEMYRQGKDIYVDMAADIYSKNISAVIKEERELGKRAVLGCGYGMGAGRFQSSCEEYAGIKVSVALAEKAVETYRNKWQAVVRFWYEQEAAALKAVQTGQIVQCGKIRWGIHNGFLYCRLPSGRCLAYYAPLAREEEAPWGGMKMTLSYMAVNSMTKKWERERTYGGKITENIVQAVARDLMAEGMLRCEAAGYENLFMVHDELISEREQGSGSVKEYEELLAKLPAWAEGCPIKAEGWTGGRYRK